MKILNSKVFRWTKEHLFKVLTTGRDPIIKNPILASAFLKVDRADFVPDKYKDLAYRDIDLEIGYKEIITKPTVVAKMLDLLDLKVGGKFLDLGTGTGYVTMLLAYIAGEKGEVFSLERVAWFYESAKSTARKYQSGFAKVNFLHKDAYDELDDLEFDAIHISFASDEVLEHFKKQLKIGGKLVKPLTDNNLRLIERVSEDEFEEEIWHGFLFEKGRSGLI